MFLRVKELPEACQPAHIRRRHGMTLLTVDPRQTRLALLTWCVEVLTPEERAAYLEGYGVSTVRAEDWMAEDVPCLLYVPPALRLTGHPPLQGGTELSRRFQQDTLTDEIEAYMAETAQTA